MSLYTNMNKTSKTVIRHRHMKVVVYYYLHRLHFAICSFTRRFQGTGCWLYSLQKPLKPCLGCFRQGIVIIFVFDLEKFSFLLPDFNFTRLKWRTEFTRTSESVPWNLASCLAWRECAIIKIVGRNCTPTLRSIWIFLIHPIEIVHNKSIVRVIFSCLPRKLIHLFLVPKRRQRIFQRQRLHAWYRRNQVRVFKLKTFWDRSTWGKTFLQYNELGFCICTSNPLAWVTDE